MLQVNPKMLPRLAEIEKDLLLRRKRAQEEHWLGEVEGIDFTLTFLAPNMPKPPVSPRDPPPTSASHAHVPRRSSDLQQTSTECRQGRSRSGAPAMHIPLSQRSAEQVEYPVSRSRQWSGIGTFGQGQMAFQQCLSSYRVCAQQSAGQPLADARPCAVVGSKQMRRLSQGEVGKGKLFIPVGRWSVDQVVHEAGQAVAASFPLRRRERRRTSREDRSGLVAYTGEIAARVQQRQALVIDEQDRAAAASSVPLEEFRYVRNGVQEQLSQAALMAYYLTAADIRVRQKDGHVQVAALSGAALGNRSPQHGTQSIWEKGRDQTQSLSSKSSLIMHRRSSCHRQGTHARDRARRSVPTAQIHSGPRSSEVQRSVFASCGQEAFLEGHVHALSVLGGVPTGIRYDNLRSAVSRVLSSRSRVENERWTAFRSHFGIDAAYCLPGIEGAHEKGGVEGQIGWFRRNHMVPVPEVVSLAELNAMIEQWDEEDERRRIGSRPRPVSEYFAVERPLLQPLPDEPFETGRLFSLRVDRFSQVSVRTNRYSVPVRLIGRTVRAILHASELVVYDGQREAPVMNG